MALRIPFPFGEFVEVCATHVEGSNGNIFVQTNSDKPKLDKLMEDIDNYVPGVLGDTKQRIHRVGDICLAKYIDDVWYRGRILSVDHSSYQIFFLDYGNTDITDAKNVLAAPERFLSLPPQCLMCELADVQPVRGEWSAEGLTTLTELLVDETFVAEAVSLKANNVIALRLFQDASRTSLVAEKLVAAGYVEKLEGTPDFSQSPAGITTRRYNYLDLAETDYLDVVVSHTEHPGKFYCQLLSNTTALQKLMEDLDDTYRQATEDDYPLTSCCQDNPCCARFSEDNMWYRASITSESPSATGCIELQYVDYGNSETAHLSNLKELDPKFLELPAQAVECNLYGIKPNGNRDEWSSVATEQFSKLIRDKHLVSYVNKSNDNTAEVYLFDTCEEDKTVNISQEMVNTENAVETKPLDAYKNRRTRRRKSSSFGIINLVSNSKEDVLVTSADSPSEFYCQLCKHAGELDMLMNSIAEYYGETLEIDDIINLPQPAMLCCGKYTADDGWYRALITSVDIASREVNVLYVDYGNSETLPMDHIKELKPQFTSFPQQAIPCNLYGISPSAATWTDDAVQEFQNVVLDKVLTVHVVSQSESQRYNVILLETVGESEYSMNSKLVQKGFAIADEVHPGVPVEATLSDYRPVEVVVGNYYDMQVSHIDNLDQFWCHLLTSSDEMDNLSDNLQEYYEANPPVTKDSKSFTKGSPCCARFSEDNTWYRGKVLEKIPNDRFKVNFVDYGNSEVLPQTSVAVINPEFLQLPIQAIRCGLSAITHFDKNRNKFIKKMKNMVVNRELVCRIDECEDGDFCHVLIIDSSEVDGININEELSDFIAKGGKEDSDADVSPVSTCKVREPSLAIDDELAVFVTSVTSPNDFFCQLVNSSQQLDDLMNQIEEYYRPLAGNEETYVHPQVGEACCAMFTEDDGWYRAVVTTVTGKMVGVCYLDYGNCEDVPLSRVKTLNLTFTELPAQAFNAKIVPDVPSGFEAKVLDKELKARIVDRQDGGVYIVELMGENGTSLFSSEDDGNNLESSAHAELCDVAHSALTLGSEEKVFVTSVTGPQEFFCQLCKTSDQLENLMEEIEEYYRPLSSNDDAYVAPRVNEACCAMFTEDDGWYRARVTMITGDSIRVCYLDYGNSESLSLERVKVLKAKYAAVTAQGFRASLNIGADVADFEASVMEQELVAKIVKQKSDGFYDVELSGLDGVSLFSAGTKDGRQEAVVREFCNVSEPNISIGNKEQVYITSATSSTDFFCQLVKTSMQLDDLMNQIDEFYHPLGKDEEVFDDPKIGEACCGMFTEDDGWYRAIVTKLTDQMVEVCYLDYGNSEEMPLSRVKRLLPCFTEATAHGFKASLARGATVGTAEFKDAVDEKTLTVNVVGRSDGGGYEVEVYGEDGRRLFGSQQRKGETCIKGYLDVNSVSPGDKLDVCGSHCESPNLFYCHMLKTGSDLEKTMNDLEEVYSNYGPKDKPIVNPVVGMFCTAKFPADDVWYRAQITSIPLPNQVEVSFVDFGNKEYLPLDRLRILAPAFYHTPTQAVRCSLDGAKTNWNQNEREAFEILTLEQHLIAEVKSSDKDSKMLTIKLFDTRSQDDLNILDVLTSKTTPSPSQPTAKLPKVTALPKLELKDVERVLIESAESLDSFFCQLSRFDHDLDTVADMMYEIYHEGDAPGGISGPLDAGDLIAAMFTDDETWYRAFVSDRKPDGIIEVTFIDYGNKEDVSPVEFSRRVKPLTKELLRYPALRAVECALSRVGIDGQRYSWTARAHEAFARYVVEKCFRAKMTSQEPFCVILDGDSGNMHSWLKQEGLVADRGSDPEVVQEDYYEIEVQEGASCDVYVTFAVNPELFYVQQAVNEEGLNKVMDDLHTSCEDGTRGSLVNISTGTLCAAQFTGDDAWYRGRVGEVIGPDSYEVIFVDYGNSEVLPKERLRELDPSLLELPAQALRCGLELKKPMAWNTETNERFDTVTTDKCLKMRVSKVREDRLLVILTDEEGSLVNDEFEGASKKTVEKIHKKDMIAPVTLSLFPITEKQTVEVYVSHVVTPGEFYVQLSESEVELDNLEEQCAETYNEENGNEYVMGNPEKGMFCCARFSEDALWYRAQITSIGQSNQSAVVMFVDHGNSDVVNLASDLRLVTPALGTTPCQAIKCSLAQSSWTAAQTSAFEAAALDKPLQATFNDLADDTWMVALSDGATCLNQLPAFQPSPSGYQKQHFAKQKLSSDDVEHAVYLVSVDSHDDVILQLADHVTQLDAMMSDIDDNPPQGNLCGAEVDVACLGQFTDDEAWYRARIMEITAGQMHVRYVDYGNEEWLPGDRVAPITPDFCTLPEVCFDCVLHGARDAWGETSGEQLMELYGESELSCKIVAEHAGKVSVKLYHDGDDVLAKVLGTRTEDIPKVDRETATTSAYTSKTLKEGERKEVTCSHIDSPGTLWCQLLEDQEILNDVMTRLDAAYSGLTPEDMLLTSFAAGTPCCGQFLEDDGWYRGEILGKDEDGVEVHYVDYGNMEVLPESRVRKLMTEFRDTPRQAVEFHLAGVQAVGEEDWSLDAVILVEEFVSDNALVVVIGDLPGACASGVIYGVVDGSDVSLNALLVEKGFAVKVAGPVQPVAVGTESVGDAAEATSVVQATADLSYPETNFEVGDDLGLFYVAADSPATISCQQSATESDLLALMDALGAFYNNLTAEEYQLEPTVGAVCCAQFMEDDSWYRGEILDVSENVFVHFVDYGNCEELPRSRVKRLQPEFVALPKQAVLCSLSGVRHEVLQGWTEEQKAQMEEICCENCYVGKIRGIKGETLEVTLYDQETQVSLVDELTRAGLMTKSSEIPAEESATSVALPEDLKLPEDIVAPEDLKLPEDIVAPEDLKLPEDTVAPEDLKLPEDIVAPEDLKLPEDIVAPEDLKLPEDIVAPEDLKLPEDIVAPEDLKLPEDIVAPEDLKLPEDTVAPEDLKLPQDTVTPEDLKLPEDTVFPEDMDIPDVPVVLEGTARLVSENALQEDTSVPENTMVPEDIAIPEDTALPEDPVIPEDTALPEDTVVPEDTAIPEDSTDSEDTLSMEESIVVTDSPEMTCVAANEEASPSEEAASRFDFHLHTSSEEQEEIQADEEIENITVEETKDVSSGVEIPLEESPEDGQTVGMEEGQQLFGDALPTSEHTHGLFDTNTSVAAEGEMSEAQVLCEAIDKLLGESVESNINSASCSTLETPNGGVEAEETTSEVCESDVKSCTSDERTSLSPETERSDIQDGDSGRQNFSSLDIKLGDILKVKLSHIQSPSSFFCQLSTATHQLDQLMETIQTKYGEPSNDTIDTYTLDTPTVGTPCCAQSPDDGKWYRAVVTATDERDVDVSFVDFGITAIVPIEKLRVLMGDLVTTIPRQALHCSLVDLEPANSEWSAEAVTKMNEVCTGKGLEAIFRSHRRRKYDIYLRDPENDVADFVNKLLVDLRLAKVTGRDPESDEGLDSNGNGSSKDQKASEPADDDDQQSLSSHSLDQNGGTEAETIRCVLGLLEDVLERVVCQDGETDTAIPGNYEIEIHEYVDTKNEDEFLNTAFVDAVAAGESDAEVRRVIPVSKTTREVERGENKECELSEDPECVETDGEMYFEVEEIYEIEDEFVETVTEDEERRDGCGVLSGGEGSGSVNSATREDSFVITISEAEQRAPHAEEAIMVDFVKTSFLEHGDKDTSRDNFIELEEKEGTLDEVMETIDARSHGGVLDFENGCETLSEGKPWEEVRDPGTTIPGSQTPGAQTPGTHTPGTHTPRTHSLCAALVDSVVESATTDQPQHEHISRKVNGDASANMFSVGDLSEQNGDDSVDDAFSGEDVERELLQMADGI